MYHLRNYLSQLVFISFLKVNFPCYLMLSYLTAAVSGLKTGGVMGPGLKIGLGCHDPNPQNWRLSKIGSTTTWNDKKNSILKNGCKPRKTKKKEQNSQIIFFRNIKYPDIESATIFAISSDSNWTNAYPLPRPVCFNDNSKAMSNSFCSETHHSAIITTNL